MRAGGDRFVVSLGVAEDRKELTASDVTEGHIENVPETLGSTGRELPRVPYAVDVSESP